MDFWEPLGRALKKQKQKNYPGDGVQPRWGSPLAGREQHFASWEAEVPISSNADARAAPHESCI